MGSEEIRVGIYEERNRQLGTPIWHFLPRPKDLSFVIIAHPQAETARLEQRRDQDGCLQGLIYRGDCRISIRLARECESIFASGVPLDRLSEVFSKRLFVQAQDAWLESLHAKESWS